eukprot:743361-Rhodomonas_salina.3
MPRVKAPISESERPAGVFECLAVVLAKEGATCQCEPEGTTQAQDLKCNPRGATVPVTESAS